MAGVANPSNKVSFFLTYTKRTIFWVWWCINRLVVRQTHHS